MRPPKPGEVVDLGAKFGVAVGSDSDSSDAEFAPEDEEQDSEGASRNIASRYGHIVHYIGLNKWVCLRWLNKWVCLRWFRPIMCLKVSG